MLRVHSFLLSLLGSRFVGTGEVRRGDILGSEVSGTHLCNYRFVGCNVAHVLGRVDQSSG